MAKSKVSHGRMTVTELEEFLRNPPAGFTVEPLRSGYRVHSEEQDSLVLLDDLLSLKGERVVFSQSPGREVKMRNLWEYTSMRKSLLSKKIYVLVSACQRVCPASKKNAASQFRVLKQFVVCINDSDPFMKWQMEKGLDWTISSVVGESYRVDIDLTEAVESWARTNLPDGIDDIRPEWRDASFTLKYYSDALFDFPHWFGFSKRKFSLRLA